MHSIIVIAHNIRSTHNVGSLLRTAEGLGVEKVYLTGYTPYPLAGVSDERLPHLAQKLDKQIRKTALGAEAMDWQHASEVLPIIASLKADGYQVTAIEQAASALALPDFKPPDKLALIVGREVEGIELEILAEVDKIIEIPMFGQKESFNVIQAAAMALYHCRFYN